MPIIFSRQETKEKYGHIEKILSVYASLQLEKLIS
jgi:hypothetical protein